MLHFIAGVLVGSLAATDAIALISNNEDALREQKIRELRTANRTRRNTPAPSAWRCTGGHAA